jgi:hypothetical protein
VLRRARSACVTDPGSARRVARTRRRAASEQSRAAEVWVSALPKGLPHGAVRTATAAYKGGGQNRVQFAAIGKKKWATN